MNAERGRGDRTEYARDGVPFLSGPGGPVRRASLTSGVGS